MLQEVEVVLFAVVSSWISLFTSNKQFFMMCKYIKCKKAFISYFISLAFRGSFIIINNYIYIYDRSLLKHIYQASS